MTRIDWSDLLYPTWDQFISELRDQYGEPQIWGGIVEEPTQLKSRHRWAQGRRRGGGTGMPRPCVWVQDNIYTWYLLKWR